MTTKRLILDLVAFIVTTTFLLFFVPFALNARDTMTNVMGVVVIATFIVGCIAYVHSKFT